MTNSTTTVPGWAKKLALICVKIVRNWLVDINRQVEHVSMDEIIDEVAAIIARHADQRVKDLEAQVEELEKCHQDPEYAWQKYIADNRVLIKELAKVREQLEAAKGELVEANTTIDMVIQKHRTAKPTRPLYIKEQIAELERKVQEEMAKPEVQESIRQSVREVSTSIAALDKRSIVDPAELNIPTGPIATRPLDVVAVELVSYLDGLMPSLGAVVKKDLRDGYPRLIECIAIFLTAAIEQGKT